MNVHHLRALRVLGLTALLDCACGLAFGMAQHVGPWDGLYWSVTTATTVGYGDISPRGWLPHILAVACMLTVLPLFTTVFSLVTSGFTTSHIDARHAEMKQHVTQEARTGSGT